MKFTPWIWYKTYCGTIVNTLSLIFKWATLIAGFLLAFPFIILLFLFFVIVELCKECKKEKAGE